MNRLIEALEQGKPAITGGLPFTPAYSPELFSDGFESMARTSPSAGSGTDDSTRSNMSTAAPTLRRLVNPFSGRADRSRRNEGGRCGIGDARTEYGCTARPCVEPVPQVVAGGDDLVSKTRSRGKNIVGASTQPPQVENLVPIRTVIRPGGVA